MGRWNWLVRGSLVVQGATIYALTSWLQLPQTATLHLIFAVTVGNRLLASEGSG